MTIITINIGVLNDPIDPENTINNTIIEEIMRIIIIIIATEGTDPLAEMNMREEESIVDLQIGE